MARFRKIDVRMWGDDRFRDLSAPPPNGRDCWIHLLTNRETSNIPGVYRAYEEALARDLGWPLEGYREAFREVSRKGMAKADWNVGLVFIPNAIRHNPPESPNVVKGWRSVWDEIPECSLKTEAYEHLKDFMKGMGEGFREGFRKALGEPSANQEQEQEQENTHSRACDPPTPTLATSTASTAAPAAAPRPPSLRSALAAALVPHRILAPPIDLLDALEEICNVIPLAGHTRPPALLVVEAYEKYRQTCTRPPGWNASAVRRHSAEVQRIAAGEKPPGPLVVTSPRAPERASAVPDAEETERMLAEKFGARP